MTPSRLSSLLIAGAALFPLQSHALNIVLSNDDGFTVNVQAMQTALEAAGHDVILSVPCYNQSGKGASINFLQPIGPLEGDCIGNAAPAGAPGVGEIAGLNNAFYVAGTPVMALLYGIDVQAQAQWGQAPDLVISGPNEGQNLGSITISSGTVSNAQYALSRGIPAIAVSADGNTTDDEILAAEAADLTLKLLDTLEQQSRDGELLPEGLALNVNFPAFEAGESTALPWTLTRFGNFDSYKVYFAENLGDDPVASAYGISSDLPGISIAPNSIDAAEPGTDTSSEAYKVAEGHVTITPMEFGYETATGNAAPTRRLLKSLLD
ncbi:acid phosphatase [Marinobacterium nitratireducens]|uniref:5'-nucleotidase n=1 Tax=Marinobacterium nitratireducens TaxID=518897 RepID=A0A917ZL64_9GAMM|nr:5'/3'-nucleotidase SurE [Marinobacterium nitratireducens]GGO85562.1 acid phosphatase [Marinobacterium nitratireducens]